MKLRNRMYIISCLIVILMSKEITISAEYEVKAIYNQDRNCLLFEGKQFNLLNEIKPEKNAEDNFGFVIFMISFLTLFAGAVSGLTVGYLSIDDLVLELKANTGTDIEKKYSQKILPIISQRHWLLVTLLICNASAMEALPIYLNKLVDEFMAIIISVTLVLFFGEIIPQAFCTGPKQLQIAYYLAPLTNLLMYITFPASYPIAMILDYLLGKHSKSRFVNTDLKGLIELHTMEALAKISSEEGNLPHANPEEIGLHSEQKDLMISAIEIKKRKVIEIMIPMNKVFMIDYDQEIDRLQLNLILDKGFSRIPVYQKDRNNVIGLFRIKQLIGVDISQNKSIRNLGLKLSPPLIVHPNTPALEVLSEFKKGKSHMAFVTEQVKEYQKKFGLNEENSFVDNSTILNNNLKNNQMKSKILGSVTLEDVLEKMINIDILDEDDYRRTKTLHHKAGTNNKTKFYREAITKQLAKSFMKDNRFGSLIENSYNAKTSQSILGIYDKYDNNLNQMNELSYVENVYAEPTLKDNSLKEPLINKNNMIV